MEDRDIGEMFLNLMLRKEVMNYCGVDISNDWAEEGWERDRMGGWGIWERNMMGMTNSLYHTCQAVTWSKELALENR